MAAAGQAYGRSDRWRTCLRPIVLAVAVTVAVVGCGDQPAADGFARPVMVVQPEPAASGADVFPGEVRARREVALAFRLGGEVVSRAVDVGDAVTRGQVLAELDPRDAELQSSSARARLAAAEAGLSVARAERDRAATLAERQLVSRSLLDAADNQLSAAQAQLDQARAELEITRNQSGYTHLRAPEAGVVAERSIEVGQVVASGQPAFVLAVDGAREVLIHVPEQRRDAFAPGREVSVELWSRPGRPVPGSVRERAPAADPGARTYAVRVGFDAEAIGAELGQSARVYASSESGQGLSLPLSAVSAEQGEAFVWRYEPGDSTLQRRPVQVRAFGESRVEIIEGVAVDDWIVLAGVHLLREGQPVSAVDRHNRPLGLSAP